MLNILIAGGTGLIGRRLQAMLKEKGHSVSILARKKAQYGVFLWNPESGYIDEAALDGIDVVVNLAGANLDGGRWTKHFKQEIIDSRVQGAMLLYKLLDKHRGKVRTYISASAIGIYGNTGEPWVDEQAPPGHDFLAATCVKWEEGAEMIGKLGIRAVILRTGPVLSEEAGMLPVIARPARWGLAAAFGDGRQYMSWIHIHDLCNIYVMAIEQEALRGTYNAVAPAPERQSDFMKVLCKTLKRPFWLPPLPAWVLKMALGEKAMLVLSGQRVNSEKTVNAGYQFRFRTLEKAIEDLIK